MPPQDPTAEPDANQLRLVRADARVVRGETTFVATGAGYELVARSKADIIILQPVIEEQGRVFRRVFRAEPQQLVVVARRRALRRGAPELAYPALPAADPNAVFVTFDVGRGVDGRGGAEGGRSAAGGGLPSPDSLLRLEDRPGQRVMAAWMKGLAATVGRSSGRSTAMPLWALAAIPGLVDEEGIEELVAVQLASHPEVLLPVERVLADDCVADAAERAATDQPPGAPSRGRPIRDLRALREGPPLSGAALCRGEALLFARYLMSREGYGILGEVIAAQMAGRPPVEGLAGARSVATDLSRLDGEWRRWLFGRADQAGSAARR